MRSRKDSNAIVVGAGIVGAACAAALTRDGWGVTIIDRAFAAAGTTSVGMGHLVAMDDSPDATGARPAYSVRSVVGARVSRWTIGPEARPVWYALAGGGRSATRTPCGRSGGSTPTRGVHDARSLDEHDVADASRISAPGLPGALRVPGDAVVYPPGVTLQSARTGAGSAARASRRRRSA